MKADQLRELADRCEADGPNFALEHKIYKLVRPEEYQRRVVALLAGPMGLRLSPVDYDGYIKPPAYTASLDAAMTLVPEGLGWSIYSDGPTYNASAEVGPHPTCGELLSSEYAGEAATPALAVCAAALRARAGKG